MGSRPHHSESLKDPSVLQSSVECVTCRLLLRLVILGTADLLFDRRLLVENQLSCKRFGL